MEETKKCPYCGEEILAVAKKCRFCGEWLDKEPPKKKTIACPICGEQIEEGSTICPICHENIKQEETECSESPAPPQDTDNENSYIKDENCNDESMSCLNAYLIKPLTRGLFDYTNPATRKEFWMTALFISLSYALLETLFVFCTAFDIPLPITIIFSSVFGLLFFLGLLAITARRLVDTGRNWVWLLILLVFPIGQICMIVFCCQEGKKKNGNVKFSSIDIVTLVLYAALNCVLWYATSNKTSQINNENVTSMTTNPASEYVDSVATDTVAETDSVVDSQDTTSEETYSYHGNIGDKYNIEAELTIKRSGNATEYDGRYWYEGKSGYLELSGSGDGQGHDMSMNEYSNDGFVTGTFEGNENDDGSISGTFTNKKNKTFTFVLYRN